MVEKLLSEVKIGIESGLEGVSADLLHEGQRLDKLYNDLRGVRPVVEDLSGGTRETTIHGLFFGGLLGKAFREIVELSGAAAAFVSLGTGLTGTFLDQLFLKALEVYSKVKSALARAAAEIKEGGLADYIYRHSHDEGWKGTLWQAVEDMAYPILGPEPPEYALLDEDSTEPNVPKMGDPKEDMDKAISNIKAMQKAVEDDPNLTRALDRIASIKELEKILTINPKKVLADFWTDAITKTSGWADIISGSD